MDWVSVAALKRLTEGEGSGVSLPRRERRLRDPRGTLAVACRSQSRYGPLTVRGAPRSSVDLLRISRKRTRAERGWWM